MSKPRLTALPAVLFLVGLGLSLHYGHAWWRMPVYSEEDIAASVELNLAMDLQRQGGSTRQDSASLETTRHQVDQEVRAAIARDREDILRGLAAGTTALLLSLCHMLWLRRLAGR
ncbi:hypothetical protein ED208_13730 [Stagnimonas aquatica]|uniref:Uncharacterized protein n=1 Tax=Stagnimonas aquatica TaxID=2689987 RepID=A0A3N0V5E0_9GAMM|nr:hypothetical protein [Stagnimonas aquatica]ROH87771.1 hypothetical protein ED208_13730 [Stagnimonas aquatica]